MPAAANASLKIARIGDEFDQCERDSPPTWKQRSASSTTCVAGNGGSPGPEQPLTCEKPHPVDNDLADIVSHREEPCREALREFCSYLARILNDTLPSTTSTCLSFMDAIAPSRAPVSRVKAIRARLRSCTSVVSE